MKYSLENSFPVSCGLLAYRKTVFLLIQAPPHSYLVWSFFFASIITSSSVSLQCLIPSCHHQEQAAEDWITSWLPTKWKRGKHEASMEKQLMGGPSLAPFELVGRILSLWRLCILFSLWQKYKWIVSHCSTKVMYLPCSLFCFRSCFVSF